MREIILQEKTQLVDPEQLKQQLHDSSLRVEFGFQFTTEYTKHGAQGVKDVLFNPNTKAFVSYNEKQIHVWSQQTGEQLFVVNFFEETRSHQISCMTYSLQHYLYLVISTDFKLHVFNENLILVESIPMKTRLINQCYFYLVDKNIYDVFRKKVNFDIMSISVVSST